MKKTPLKRLTLATLLLGLALSALGCATTTTTTTTAAATEAVIPQISDPDAVFYQSLSGFTVTYGELFQEFKINDGLTQLLLMVDEALFSTYLAEVTADEIAQKREYLLYGTNDAEEIAAFTEDEVAGFEEDYANNMFLLGYEGAEEDYIRLICAKENYAIEAMQDADNAAQSWYVGEKTIAQYYESSYYQDVTAIKIRFVSAEDAKAALRSRNLVSYHGKLREYTGTVPIENMPSFAFDETNTAVMTDAEILSAFIDIYNEVYGAFRTPIASQATVADLQANPDLQIGYLDLKEVQTSLATYVFDTLGNFEDSASGSDWYTYSPVQYAGDSDTANYLILKVSDDNDKADLSGFEPEDDDLSALITPAVYDEIAQILLKTNRDASGTVSTIVSRFREAHDFEILDYYLGLDYQMLYSAYIPTKTGDATLIAKYDSVSLTADNLLTYVMNKNAPFYVMYAGQMEIAMNDYYPLVYCAGATLTCEMDPVLNHSDKIIEHQDTLAELKTNFEESYYAYYYSWLQWLYLAYGVTSEEEMITRYYIKSTLQPYIIYEDLRSDDWALLSGYLQGLIGEFFDNYFDLYVETLTITVDRDEDGAADDYEAFVASQSDPVAYAALKGRFEAAIRTYLSVEGNTLSGLAKAYTKALRSDATWGEFRRFGLQLAYKDVSGTTSTTYVSAKSGETDEDLLAAMTDAYVEYLLPANFGLDSLLYSGTVENASGITFLSVEPGSNFDRPSAQFENLQDNEGNWLCSEGIDNDSDLPNLSQLKLYCEYRFDQMVYGTDSESVEETYGVVIPKIPTSVLSAMTAYFETVHDSMYVIGYLNIIVTEKLQTGTFQNGNPAYGTFQDADIKADLARIGALYHEQVFGDYDPAE